MKGVILSETAGFLPDLTWSIPQINERTMVEVGLLASRSGDERETYVATSVWGMLEEKYPLDSKWLVGFLTDLVCDDPGDGHIARGIAYRVTKLMNLDDNNRQLVAKQIAYEDCDGVRHLSDTDLLELREAAGRSVFVGQEEDISDPAPEN